MLGNRKLAVAVNTGGHSIKNKTQTAVINILHLFILIMTCVSYLLCIHFQPFKFKTVILYNKADEGTGT